jgi:hypothetical protein
MLSRYVIYPGSLPPHLSQQITCVEGEAGVIRAFDHICPVALKGAGMRAATQHESIKAGLSTEVANRNESIQPSGRVHT